jgi:CheY-like chemotaxis protein
MSPDLIAFLSRMARLTADHATKEPPIGPLPPYEPPRVLVVEPNRKDRHELVAQLQWQELRTMVVADSLSALNAIDCQPLDLILLSCNEPGAAVYDATMRSAVITRARQARIPLFLLSTTPGEHFWQHCLESEIENLLQKPHAQPEPLRLWLQMPQPVIEELDSAMIEFDNVHQYHHDCLAQDIQGIELAATKFNQRLLVHYAHRLNGATHIMQIEQAADLALRVEQAARGEIPLDLDAIRGMLAELKAAIARHFAEAPPPLLE